MLLDSSRPALADLLAWRRRSPTTKAGASATQRLPQHLEAAVLRSPVGRPGEQDTPLYFVTAEFAAASISELVRSGDLGAIYHVCHSAAESLTLGQLVDLAFERFEREEDFRKRRILRPLFCDAEAFDLLADGVDSFAGAVVNQGLQSVRPFAKQLFAAKSIANERLVTALERYAAPNAKELVGRTCEFLVRTRGESGPMRLDALRSGAAPRRIRPRARRCGDRQEGGEPTLGRAALDALRNRLGDAGGRAARVSTCRYSLSHSRGYRGRDRPARRGAPRHRHRPRVAPSVPAGRGALLPERSASGGGSPARVG
jgi:hypothetical protein